MHRLSDVLRRPIDPGRHNYLFETWRWVAEVSHFLHGQTKKRPVERG